MNEYVVDFSIPPMRALLHRTVMANSEDDALEKLKDQMQINTRIIEVRLVKENRNREE